MDASTGSSSGISIRLIEGGLTLIAIALSFAWPRIGSGGFSWIEREFGRLARKRRLAVATVGISAILLRLGILHWFPIPLPFVPDDFSFLLAVDTFIHGRLANPTPAMWPHFESIHIDMFPTYMSMYFPGNALVLAAGKMLFGTPWYGLLIVNGLMCAALCWMLQAWLPPTWALLGGFLACLRLALFSYWINTYSGGGSLSALGGALVLGSLPRFMRAGRFRHAMLMGTGVVMMAYTRPYEATLLCLPVAAALGHWLYTAKNRPRTSLLLRRAVAPLLLIVAAAAWLGYYDDKVFGNPLTLPYTINRATYAMAPYFIWQSPRPAPVYRNEAFKRFYSEIELRDVYKTKNGSGGYIHQTVVKVVNTILFYEGFALLPLLFMLQRVLLDRRTRFLVLSLVVLTAGMGIEIFLIPHYIAPFTVAIYALGLQSMRHLRNWKYQNQKVGMTIVRLTVTVCVLMAGLRLFAGSLHIAPREWPASNWTGGWYGPEHFGSERAQIESRLEQLPGNQIAIVQFAPSRDSLDEWVYNGADIDSSKVIWARDLGAASNLQLCQYYRDRKAWFIKLDVTPAEVTQYPLPPQPAPASR